MVSQWDIECEYLKITNYFYQNKDNIGTETHGNVYINNARTEFTNWWCKKKENSTLLLTLILQLWHSHDYKFFCLQLVTFEMLNPSPRFGVDRHLL